MNWKVEKGTIVIDGLAVAFSDPVQEVVEAGDILIVLLTSSTNNRNVFGIDSRGQTLWQIKEKPRIGGGSQNPVTGLIEIDGKLALYFWEGLHAILDHKTGEYRIPSGQRPW